MLIYAFDCYQSYTFTAGIFISCCFLIYIVAVLCFQYNHAVLCIIWLYRTPLRLWYTLTGLVLSPAWLFVITLVRTDPLFGIVMPLFGIVRLVVYCLHYMLRLLMATCCFVKVDYILFIHGAPCLVVWLSALLVSPVWYITYAILELLLTEMLLSICLREQFSSLLLYQSRIIG